MADNTVLNTGAGGDTIATDDIAGIKHQRVKVEFGADGSASDVATANPLPVTPATAAADNGALPSVQDVVAGYDGANVQVLKTDVNGLLAVQDGGGTISVDDGAGSLTVDGTVAVSGTVTVDSELTTADLDTGAGTDTRAVIGLAGTKSGGAALIPGDATKGLAVDLTATGANATALKVDGSAVTQPVSGTVTGNLAPTATGGLTISRTLSAATTNSTSVKGSGGQIYGWFLYNANAAVRYLKVYNKATAPTVGSDTPVMTLPIPPGAAANVEYTQGLALGTGIGIAITTGVADADTGAVAANEIIINLFYK